MDSKENTRQKDYSTKQREFIIELFRNNAEKCFATEDVVASAEDAGISVGQTTVYRNLEKLVNEGVLMKYTMASGSKAFFKFLECSDEEQHDHYHLFCTDCGDVVHLECGHMDEIFEHISREHEFKTDLRKTVFYGKCGKCAVV